MEKSKTQNIIFGALLLAGAIIWIYPLFKGKDDLPQAKLEKYTVTEMQEPSVREDFFRIQKEKQAKRPQLLWGRDPFQLPLVKGGEGSDLVLSGIAVDEKGKIAIINNEIVRENDVMFGAKIIQIKKDSVTIERDGKTSNLKIYEKVD